MKIIMNMKKRYNSKKVEDNLKYLDEVLEIILDDSENYKIDLTKLTRTLNQYDSKVFFKDDSWDKMRKLFKSKKSLNDLDLKFEILEEYNLNSANLLIALYFLHHQGLISFQPPPKGQLFLLYPGIIKISKGGFYGEYIRQKRKDAFQKYFWIVAILTFIAGWILKPAIELIMRHFNME